MKSIFKGMKSGPKFMDYADLNTVLVGLNQPDPEHGCLCYIKRYKLLPAGLATAGLEGGEGEAPGELLARLEVP